MFSEFNQLQKPSKKNVLRFQSVISKRSIIMPDKPGGADTHLGYLRTYGTAVMEGLAGGVLHCILYHFREDSRRPTKQFCVAQVSLFVCGHASLI